MQERRPLGGYDGGAGYPAISEVVSRRGFMKKLASSATALGSLLLAGAEAEATAVRRPKVHRVELVPSRRRVLRPCNYRVAKVIVETKDEGLASFLKDRKRKPALDAALCSTIDKATCKDIGDAKALARLNKRLGKALCAVYKTSTRRKATLPDVMLVLKPYRDPVLLGFLRAPQSP